MQQEFAVSQIASLKNNPDPMAWSGVCAAMCYDWIKRGLASAPIGAGTYADANRFVAQQRPYLDTYHTLVPKLKQQMGQPGGGGTGFDAYEQWVANDKLTQTVVKTGPSSGGAYAALGAALGALPAGAYRITLWTAKDVHDVAFNTTATTARFFDPNVGQFRLTSPALAGTEVAQVLAQVYGGQFSPGFFRICRIAGTPRDSQWLLANP